MVNDAEGMVVYIAVEDFDDELETKGAREVPG